MPRVQRRVVRVIAFAAAVVLGAAVGLAGSFVHDTSVTLIGIGWPVGLVISLAAAAATCVIAGALARSRAGTALAAAAWVLSALVVSAPRPEGDIVIAGGPAGYIYLYGGTILAAFVATLPVLGARPPDRREPG